MKTQYNENELQDFGARLGRVLAGGEVLELVGDVGAGKTTLSKGIARGLDIAEPVQSPTFTISRVYAARDDLRLVHYDFYRLSDAGIMRDELAESIDDEQSIVILEWADIVDGVLPEDRLTIHITPVDEDTRELSLEAGGSRSTKLLETIS